MNQEADRAWRTRTTTSGRGQRDLTVKVKTARGRKLVSTRWLQRQLNDPYVKRAKAEGYRGRAAYKILELDDKFRFLVPGARVVDLGCAPGGWCQVAVSRVNALGEKPGKAVGRVIGIDLQEVEPIPGAELHQLDFLDEDADEAVKAWLGGGADVVMSDMAAASSGHKQTDHLRIIAAVRGGGAFRLRCAGGRRHLRRQGPGRRGRRRAAEAAEAALRQGRQRQAARIAVRQFGEIRGGHRIPAPEPLTGLLVAPWRICARQPLKGFFTSRASRSMR